MPIDEESIDTNLKLLRFFSFHDRLFALIITLSIIYYAPAIGTLIASLPFIEFFLAFYRSKKVPEDYIKKISCDISFSSSYYIRLHNRPTQAHSLPFFRMILLNKYDYNALLDETHYDRKRVIGIFAHELGHLGQYDRLILRYLQCSLGFIFLVFITNLGSDILNGSFFSIENPRKATDYISLTVFFISQCFLLISIYRVVHRREHIADLEGYQLCKAGILSFLNDGLNIDDNSEKIPRSFWETHPSFLKRLKILSNSLPAHLLQAKTVSIQWFLCMWVITSLVLSNILGNKFFIYHFISLCPLIFLPMFNLAILDINIEPRQKILRAYSSGLLIATLVTFSFISFIAILAKGFEQYSPLVLLGFLLYLIPIGLSHKLSIFLINRNSS